MTSTVRWPLRRIDYLLVSGIEVGEIRVLDQPLSDHRALTATFALASTAKVQSDELVHRRHQPSEEERASVQRR
jgi:hypothetical protein